MVSPASHGLPHAPRYSRSVRTATPRFRRRGSHPLWPAVPGPWSSLTVCGEGSAEPSQTGAQPHPCNACRLTHGWFRLLPVRSPLLREYFLFLGVLRCFSSPTYLHPAYVFSGGYRAITPGELPHSGIDDALPACSPSSLFAACRALHRPVSPRHPPHTRSRVSSSRSSPAPMPTAANTSLDAFATTTHHSTPPAPQDKPKARRSSTSYRHR